MAGESNAVLFGASLYIAGNLPFEDIYFMQRQRWFWLCAYINGIHCRQKKQVSARLL